MIYAISDIHGNMRRFRSVMDQIRLKPEDDLYIIGDVIDRHPDGIAILQEIMRAPNMHMLLGNHEYMMVNAICTGRELPWSYHQDKFDDYRLWYHNGGEVTCKAYRALPDSEQEEIMDFLMKLPLVEKLNVNGQKFILAHAALPKWFTGLNMIQYRDVTEFCVWKRGINFSKVKTDGVFVFGHTPTINITHEDPMRIWYGRGESVIDIDCGSGLPDVPNQSIPFQGHLACLRLDDLAEFYSIEDKDDTKK